MGCRCGAPPPTGWKPKAADQIPIIDRVPGATNALFATGWSGHGWAIAPAVTELLADWAQSGDQPGPTAVFCLQPVF